MTSKVIIIFIALVLNIQCESFKDSNGRKITITKPFKRIISLYGAHTENLFSLGLNKEIIGVSKHEVYPAEALKKPTFSYRDNIEHFLAAKPDLILIRPMILRAYGKLFNHLTKLGITVVSIQPKSVDEMFDYWEKLGMLTGRKQEANMMINIFKSKITILNKKLAKIANKKNVYFEAIHKKMKTFSRESIAMFALSSAGGINIAIDAKAYKNSNVADYGKERIISKGKKIDVFLAQRGPMNKITIKIIKNESGFKAIKAVKNGEIFIVDEKIVSRPTLRLLIGIKSIAFFLYPNYFK